MLVELGSEDGSTVLDAMLESALAEALEAGDALDAVKRAERHLAQST